MWRTSLRRSVRYDLMVTNSQLRKHSDLAFCHGPTKPPLLNETVGQNFSRIVSKYGDRPAVISAHQKTTVTYHALNRKSDALARGLESIGVTKGLRVAVSLGNSSEYAIITYALFKLGAILVPLNPAFTAEQVQSALRHLSASHLIIGSETNLPWKAPRSNVPILKHIISDVHRSKLESPSIPSLRNVVIVDNSDGRLDVSSLRSLNLYQDVFEDGDTGHALDVRQLDPNDIVNIQFTSGTTSTPKAASLTHRSILNNGKSIGDRMLLTADDVVCCPPPLFHCFGCILGYMAAATHGASIVFPAEAFNPQLTLQAAQDYSCTALYGVPTMFNAELELLSTGAFKPSPTGFSHLRTGIAAGSSIPAELMRKLHRVLNLTELTICYGQTETSPVSAMTTTDDPLEKRIDTVGRLLPHVSAKVVDPTNKQRILTIGERGELAVSGYLVMQGYWGDEARTKEVMVEDDDGVTWMHTGDEALIDAEGYVKITGRLKDIIIRGGENIHPLDIENCVLAHDSVADVSAVGVPDSHYGEVIAVFIIPKKGARFEARDVREWVKSRLSGHFVPKYVFWIDSFPKTPSGKVQRFKLQGEVEGLLKLGQGL